MTVDCNIPPGRWGVGVSGGADSVALLRMVAGQDVHVLHFDHVTRDCESATDAVFVVDLAAQLKLPCAVGRRSDSDSTEQNWPARLRAARFQFFSDQVRLLKLDGVLLAHHADDQAETAALQLLRRSRPVGMRADTSVDGLRIVRPLLGVPAESLRDFLRAIGQPWREDASNQSDEYARNRLRPLLRSRPVLSKSLVDLAEATRELVDAEWRAAPVLTREFRCRELDVPPPLARAAVSRWLVEQHVEPDRRAVAAVVEMATDLASPARRQLPGGRSVRRRGGRVSIE